jgi:hypothetical protein
LIGHIEVGIVRWLPPKKGSEGSWGAGRGNAKTNTSECGETEHIKMEEEVGLGLGGEERGW